MLDESGMRQLAQRVRGAIWGMYMGDALSMPVHWYYDRRRIQQDFGPAKITKYEKPVAKFPGSIMNLSSTGGGGRGGDDGDIIGEVILHGKKQFWQRGGSYHYHHGMQPGENTLDTLLARLLLNVFAAEDVAGAVIRSNALQSADARKLLIDTYLKEYVEFMTTPDSHNDVYAATAHRMFFANYIRQLPLDKCADNDGHNTDSIDGMINVVPFTLVRTLLQSSSATTTSAAPADGGTSGTADTNVRRQWIGSIINALRRSEELPRWGLLYDELLSKVLLGADLRTAVLDVAAQIDGRLPEMLRRAGAADDSGDSDPMTACYIHSSFPAMLVFAYKYADRPKAALLASANAGGENVNRSAILGALIGAAHGPDFDLGLKKGLVFHESYEEEVENFLRVFGKSRGESGRAEL
eukprot:CAMPEP_0178994944 /NCGR_PEP_ID=MMETSP0795-20121207/7569_1 /TAXON_ID=88552 /ORGANISM="Amoebophrya sp., Strain Ameob2" /LENGTH=409 /DNA_ID=CAMNT_0020687229 /DNA_START=230 /DNA_END=1459 /DNA_ORIENTATION=+